MFEIGTGDYYGDIRSAGQSDEEAWAGEQSKARGMRDSMLDNWAASAKNGDEHAIDALYWSVINGDVDAGKFHELTGISIADYQPHSSQRDTSKGGGNSPLGTPGEHLDGVWG